MMGKKIEGVEKEVGEQVSRNDALGFREIGRNVTALLAIQEENKDGMVELQLRDRRLAEWRDEGRIARGQRKYGGG